MHKKKYLGPKIPKDWREIIGPFVWGTLFGLIVGCAALGSKVTELQEQLNDPHHCVSVCVEVFKAWGC